MSKVSNERQVLSVSQLNRNVSLLLEKQLPMLWVEGEISNLARPASGHWYLTLKDKSAQVRCAMFRSSQQRVAFTPSNGMQVLVRCKVGLYEGRGDYQLIIEHMQEAGFGALQRQFDQLKQRLHSEGLFDPNHKQVLPASIKRIGVITSPSGAAIKDILAVLARRFPAIAVSIYPSVVQGDQAATALINALEIANRDARCDVLLLSRGGGSLEDLWCFNDEALARAIFASQLPVVSAVGHEIDFTIADFVADHRAATPSAAAELLSPDSAKLLSQLQGMKIQLIHAIRGRLRNLEQHNDFLSQRLRHPGQRLAEQTQHLTHLRTRLINAITSQLQRRKISLSALSNRHQTQHPRYVITIHRGTLNRALTQLSRATTQHVQRKRQRLVQNLHLLDTVSPLKTLERGYSVLRNDDGAVIRSIAEIHDGECVKAQVLDGEIRLTATEKRANSVISPGTKTPQAT